MRLDLPALADVYAHDARGRVSHSPPLNVEAGGIVPG